MFVTTVYSQVLRPSSLPNPSSSGYAKYGYVQSDSGYLWGVRDTFPASKYTTILHNNGNFYKTPGGVGSYWTLWISKVAATVSQVNTNASTGITGGPITTTGTIAADTLVLTTRARTKQQTDSIIGLISGGGFGTVLSVSTTDMFGITSTVTNPSSTPNIALKVDTTHNNKGVMTWSDGTSRLDSLGFVKLNIADTTAMLTHYVNTFSNQTNISGTKQFNNAMVVADNITAVSFIKSGGTASQVLAASGTSLVAGSGITITGGQIINTSPSSGGTVSMANSPLYLTGFGSIVNADTGRGNAQLITGGDLNNVKDSINNIYVKKTDTGLTSSLTNPSFTRNDTTNTQNGGGKFGPGSKFIYDTAYIKQLFIANSRIGTNKLLQNVSDIYTIRDSINPVLGGNRGYTSITKTSFTTSPPTIFNHEGFNVSSFVGAQNTQNWSADAIGGHPTWRGGVINLASISGASGTIPDAAGLYMAITLTPGVTVTHMSPFLVDYSISTGGTYIDANGFVVNQMSAGTNGVAFYASNSNGVSSPPGKWMLYDSIKYKSYLSRLTVGAAPIFSANTNEELFINHTVRIGDTLNSSVIITTGLDNYATNIGNSFTARSKVDKGYVDSVKGTIVSSPFQELTTGNVTSVTSNANLSITGTSNLSALLVPGSAQINSLTVTGFPFNILGSSAGTSVNIKAPDYSKNVSLGFAPSNISSVWRMGYVSGLVHSRFAITQTGLGTGDILGIDSVTKNIMIGGTGDPLKLEYATGSIITTGSISANGLTSTGLINGSTLTIVNSGEIGGNLVITANETVGGILTVTGNESVGGNLSVTGKISALNLTATSTVSAALGRYTTMLIGQNSSSSGDALQVTGSIKASSATITGSANINGGGTQYMAGISGLSIKGGGVGFAFDATKYSVIYQNNGTNDVSLYNSIVGGKAWTWTSAGRVLAGITIPTDNGVNDLQIGSNGISSLGTITSAASTYSTGGIASLGRNTTTGAFEIFTPTGTSSASPFTQTGSDITATIPGSNLSITGTILSNNLTVLGSIRLNDAAAALGFAGVLNNGALTFYNPSTLATYSQFSYNNMSVVGNATISGTAVIGNLTTTGQINVDPGSGVTATLVHPLGFYLYNRSTNIQSAYITPTFGVYTTGIVRGTGLSVVTGNAEIAGNATIGGVLSVTGRVNTSGLTLTSVPQPYIVVSSAGGDLALARGTVPIAGSFSGAGTATTTFTVTIGQTMSNTSYKVPQPGALNVLSAAPCYITNKTTTTFDVVYLTGLTGTVAFDWAVFP